MNGLIIFSATSNSATLTGWRPMYRTSGVAAADAHDHPAVGDVVQRRVGARKHGRLARAGIRDHVTELDRRRAVGDEREHRERLLPEHVRVVRPGVLEARAARRAGSARSSAVRRVGQDGDAEAQCHAGEPTPSRSRSEDHLHRPQLRGATSANRATSRRPSPLLFGKFDNTLIGPGEAIVLPPEATHVDAEAELAVEIGLGGHRIGEDDALDHVARLPLPRTTSRPATSSTPRASGRERRGSTRSARSAIVSSRSRSSATGRPARRAAAERPGAAGRIDRRPRLRRPVPRRLRLERLHPRAGRPDPHWNAARRRLGPGSAGVARRATWSRSRSRGSGSCATRSSRPDRRRAAGAELSRVWAGLSRPSGVRATPPPAQGDETCHRPGERLRRQPVERRDRELEVLALRVLELRVREAAQALDEQHHRRDARARDLGRVVQRPGRQPVRRARDLADGLVGEVDQRLVEEDRLDVPDPLPVDRRRSPRPRSARSPPSRGAGAPPGSRYRGGAGRGAARPSRRRR